LAVRDTDRDTGDPDVVTPEEDMKQAQGTGTYAAGAEVFDFRFNARTDRQGDTRGTMTLKRNDSAFSANADVFCLAVSGHLATMVGTITETQGFEDYEELVFIANDNTGSNTPDTFAHIVKHAGEGQAECFPQTAPHAVTGGDIKVRDA
jgi:hypothetical protein